MPPRLRPPRLLASVGSRCDEDRRIRSGRKACGKSAAVATPVPEGGVRPHCDLFEAERCSAIARAVAPEFGFAVDDLESFARPRLAEFQKPVDVHFTAAGSKPLGAEVAAAVRARLVRRTKGR